jgi:ParB-like chromosome segregation protein Spo0J
VVATELIDLALGDIGEYFARYRLRSLSAERVLHASLCRYGQMSPVVVFRWQHRYEMIDGFKRLAAARTLPELTSLCARVMEADERTAKAALYALNHASGKTSELEDAWIVHALVREDGLPQVEVAELLGRHKSWVCRRLALIEKLADAAQEELKVGLLNPTCARQLVRLPPGNQAALLDAIRREALTLHEVEGVVTLLLTAPTPARQQHILRIPREALAESDGTCLPARDPRLSPAGDQIWRRLGVVLELLARMDGWLAQRALSRLPLRDQRVLAPRVARLARDAMSVALLAQDLRSEERPAA